MTVEQTTQLIQLILNSVLMTVACGLALGRMGVRHTAAEEKLQTANQWYASLLETGNELRNTDGVSLQEVRRFQVRKSLRRLQRQYTITRYSLMAAHYALFFSIVSTLTMTLRALINADWLIVVALGLFVIGVASLVFGVGLTLVDLHASDLSLWEEVQGILKSERTVGQPRLTSRVRSLKPADRAIRQALPKAKPASRARVG